jgi:hypothetical protein
MFGLFKKDPLKDLRQQYEKMLEEARDLQRKGDIKGFALKTEAAEKLMDQIQELQKK